MRDREVCVKIVFYFVLVFFYFISDALIFFTAFCILDI